MLPGLVDQSSSRDCEAYLLVSKNVNKVVKGEVALLQHDIAAVLQALTGQNQQFVAGRAANQTPNLKAHGKMSMRRPGSDLRLVMTSAVTSHL